MQNTNPVMNQLNQKVKCFTPKIFKPYLSLYSFSLTISPNSKMNKNIGVKKNTKAPKVATIV